MARQREKQERKRVTARRRLAEHRSGFQSTMLKVPEGMSFFKVDRAGNRYIDILSYRVGEGNPFADPGELYFERTFYCHRGIGVNRDSYICPAKTANERCPVCEYQAKLSRDPNNVNDELVKSLAPKQRQLWLVIDKKDEDRGVQLWDCSFHLFGKLLDNRLDNAEEDDDWDAFADPKEGSTLKVAFTEEQGGGYKWYEAVSIDFRRRVDAYDDDFIDKLPCLDEMLIIPSYDQLKKALLQVDVDEEGEVEDEPPKRSRTSVRRTKVQETVDVDEEKPAKQTKKATVPQDEESSDEEDTLDDDAVWDDWD